MSEPAPRRNWPIGVALLLAIAAVALFMLAQPQDPNGPPTPSAPPSVTPTAGLITVTASPTRRVTPKTTATTTPAALPTIPPAPTPTHAAQAGPTPSGEEPVLIDLRPCASGRYYFASGTASFRARVDWRGHAPGELVYVLAGRELSLPMSSPEAVFAVPLGHLPSGPLALNVRAEADGLRSNSLSPNPSITLLSYPTWWPMGQRTVTGASACQGAPITTTCDVLYPPQMLDGRVQVPLVVPFVGGRPLGLAPTQAELHALVNSHGAASLEVRGNTGLVLGEHRIDGRIAGDGRFALQENRLVLDEGVAGLTAAGQVTIDQPLIEIICGAATGLDCRLRELEKAPVVGSVVSVFNELAELEARFLPALETDLAFVQETSADGQTSALVWREGAGTMAMGIELALGVDMLDQLGAEAYGGGNPELSLRVPAVEGAVVQGVNLSLYAGVRLYALGMEADYPAAHIWAYTPTDGWTSPVTGGSGGLDGGSDLVGAPTWRPVRLSGSGYGDDAREPGRFVGNQRPFRLSVDAATLAADANAASEHVRLVTNIYPRSDPALAVTDQGATVVWVHDDETKPAMQGTELLVSHHAQGHWSEPTAITHDALQDLAPRVVRAQAPSSDPNAKTSGEQVLVVWQRHRSRQDADTRLDAAYVSGFEIAYAVWDGARWTKPTYLTDNDVLDHDPHLVAGNDGRPLLVWRRNAGNALLGNEASPDLLLFSVWQGAAWSPPQALPLPADGGGRGHHPIWFAAARHAADRMALVYVQDGDGTAATPDRTLHLVEYAGLAWGAPRPLTSPGAIMRPTCAYDARGLPILAWLDRNTVFARHGAWNAPTRDAITAASPGLASHRALIDGAGNVTIAWPDMGEAGPDLAAVRLRPDGSQSPQVWLTADGNLEKNVALAAGPRGELVAAYGASETRSTFATVGERTITGTIRPMRNNVDITRYTFGE